MIPPHQSLIPLSDFHSKITLFSEIFFLKYLTALLYYFNNNNNDSINDEIATKIIVANK